jgi:hypothetical protein
LRKESTVDWRKGLEDQQTENIADPFRDLLSELDHARRMGLVHLLAVGFYEGWRPTRAQVANLVAREAGRLTEEEYLSLLRARPARDERPRLSIEGLQLVQEVGKTRPIETPRSADASLANQAGPIPLRMLPFTVACGQVMASVEFVARGLSSGEWVRRGNGRYRLVSLHYQLIPAAPQSDGPNEPTIYTASITCLQDITAPSESTDGQTVEHTVGQGRVVGLRGPWPVSPAMRHLRFLIYPQSKLVEPSHHPAGALWVDLRKGQARWLQTVGRRLARTGPESIQEGSSR